MPFFPVIELVDRYVISLIKLEKTQANREEYDFYHQQISQFDVMAIETELSTLRHIHEQIWEKEKELKSNNEHKLPLEEIGRRAIEIRNLNNQRIKLKNIMAEKLCCSVKEIKTDHLSQ